MGTRAAFGVSGKVCDVAARGEARIAESPNTAVGPHVSVDVALLARPAGVRGGELVGSLR
jgi:hypothetical protein